MTLGAGLILGLVSLGCLAAGILVGRYYVPDDRMLRRTARHARSYARAASRILEGDHGGAIEELKQVVDENVDDIEAYFALGALFRGRGDWERAIRVHQSLAVRGARSKQTRLRALYALGLDFRRAGMPRRATRAMEECLDIDGKHEGALEALCGLYEEQGRYQDAAESLHRLHKLRGEAPSLRQHHLHLAAAQRAVYAGDLDRAKRLLREARRVHENLEDAQGLGLRDEPSVHQMAAAAELGAARGDAGDASARLQAALAAAPELAAFLVPGLIEAERQLVIAAWDKDKGRRKHRRGEDRAEDTADEVLRTQTEQAARRAAEALEDMLDPGEPHLQLAVAELRSHYDPVLALEDYRRIAAAFPALLPARVAAARLALASGDPDEIRAELRALAAADGVLAWATEGTWRCSGCGHRRREFFWRCEVCRRWGTVRLDLGGDALDVPPPPPWEPSGGLPRGGVERALQHSAAERALPAPTLPAAGSSRADAGSSRADAASGVETQTAGAPSMLSRVGAWFAGRSGSAKERERREEAPDSSRTLGAGPDEPAAEPVHEDIDEAPGEPAAAEKSAARTRQESNEYE